MGRVWNEGIHLRATDVERVCDGGDAWKKRPIRKNHRPVGQITTSLPLPLIHKKGSPYPYKHIDNSPTTFCSVRSMLPSSSQKAAPPETPTLLIVEDDPDLAFGLESYFSHVGYQVEMVNQGDGALETIQATDPDVVLLDWRLPGMTGSEVLREARANGLDTPAIMVSVHSRSELQTKIRDAPEPDDYVTKPFDLQDLRARVETLLQ